MAFIQLGSWTIRSTRLSPASTCAPAPRADAVVLTLLLVALPRSVLGTETEILYLSGRGSDDAVNWEFRCSDGRRCNEWQTIAVPSNWELEGFGDYNYGHDDHPSAEEGRYRVGFRVPASWRPRRVDLVFEGSMTDTEAWINGRPAGPVHQGGFYQFRYDVSELLSFGADNTLEVRVAKRSTNRSVNLAERDADYWVFGGIYRPVLLVAYPAESVRHIAIDAGHDGRLAVEVATAGLVSTGLLTAEVRDITGDLVGRPMQTRVEPERGNALLADTIAYVRQWSAEDPYLYRLVVTLRRGEDVLHRVTERFGFRTVEVRPGAGLFINGRRTLLKGVNRHSFWPDSGRTTSREISRHDAELIKRMNMNAVRSSHYPPDTHFLEACDELGLYVIDELAGWHDAYDTKVGATLVREMVRRDVNHPSVLLWANGNEGGWNRKLDRLFSELDPQQRPVIHPDAVAGGLDTTHYLDYHELASKLEGSRLGDRLRRVRRPRPLVMPTEMLHGLYDGGGGAALADYWELLRRAPTAAGAFLWAFLDEAVVRTDRDGELDAQGNYAPDGIVGPYRAPEASFDTIRALWSPIIVSTGSAFFNGQLMVENRFDATDLADCSFDWELIDYRPTAGEPMAVILAHGSGPGPPLAPGGQGSLDLGLPASWRQADVLLVTAVDHRLRDVMTWSFPIARPDVAARSGGLNRQFGLAQAPGRGDEPPADPADPVPDPPAPEVVATLSAQSIVLGSAGVRVEIDRRSGRLEAFSRAGVVFPIAGGPRLTGGVSTLVSLRHGPAADGHVVEANFEGPLRFIRWRLAPSGWLSLAYQYELRGRHDFFGVTFDLPAESLTGWRWLGRGPHRVWQNRLAGGHLGLWRPPLPGMSPCGAYADVAWARLESEVGALVVEPTAPGLFVSPCAPTYPADAGFTAAPGPPGLAFLHAISAMGTKFHPAERLGQASRKRVAAGIYRGSLRMRLEPPATEPQVVEPENP